MMLHKKIVEYHGRIENVKVFNKDPTQFILEAKEKEEARIKALKEAEKARQLAAENNEEIEETKEPAAAPEEDEVFLFYRSSSSLRLPLLMSIYSLRTAKARCSSLCHFLILSKFPVCLFLLLLLTYCSSSEPSLESSKKPRLHFLPCT